MKDHALHLQHGLIALDQLRAGGDLTDAEYLAAVEPLKVAIQRARLVEHLDYLVQAHNDWTMHPDDCRDMLLDEVDLHELSRPGSPAANLRLASRRLELLNGNSEEVINS